ncbi:MAG: outer membrane beta-barrel protein [Pseudomonadota bacterium]|nr:outer membrane beta-barrel protein [Pseudomonadota bacterium]
MKLSSLAITLLTTFCMLNSPLYAQESTFFLGAKYGQYDFTLDQASRTEDGHGFSLLGNLDLRKGLALEFEYGDSGKAEFDYDGDTITGGQIRIQHLGAYGVYRTPGSFYGKLKLGVSVNRVDATNLKCPYSLCTNTLSRDDGATVYGVGLGLTMQGRLRTELEYTVIDEDVDVLQLGFLFGL